MDIPCDSVVKNLPASTGKMQIQFLSWEDPMEKKMATHSNTLAWKIPWTEEPGGLQSMGLQGLDTTEQLTHTQNKGIEQLSCEKNKN